MATLLYYAARAGEANRARVLQALYDHGPQSRAALVRLTGVTRATIGTIVQPMISSGVLDEFPSGAAGGKPSRPLWFSPTGKPIGAVYLLPGTIEAALISAEGRILHTVSTSFPADAVNGEPVLAAVLGCLREVLPAGRGAGGVLGIGIAVAGMVDTDTGTIVKMNLAPGLAGFPIGPKVAECLAVPTYVDHQPRAQALGDRWFGVGRGITSFAAIYTGETLGVGLMLNGQVYRGPGGAGGEVGHTFVQVDGDTCRCGQHGCWETVATYQWLRREAVELGLPNASGMTAQTLSRLAEGGTQAARQLADRYARNLAVGLANLQQVLAPGLFVLHGDAATGGERFHESIEHWVRRLVPAHPSGLPHVVPTDLEHAALLGAAGLVLSHSLRLAV